MRWLCLAFCLSIATLLAFMFVRSVTTGRAVLNWQEVTARRNPIAFTIALAINAVLLLMCANVVWKLVLTDA